MRVQPLSLEPKTTAKPKRFSDLTMEYILDRFGDRSTLCYDAYADAYRVDVYKKISRNIKITQENHETPISYMFEPETGKVLSRTVTVAPARVTPSRRVAVKAKGKIRELDLSVAKPLMMKPQRRMITTDVIGSHTRTTVVVPNKGYVKVMDNDYTTLGKLRKQANNSFLGKLNRAFAPFLAKGSNDIEIVDRRVAYAFLDPSAPLSEDLYPNMRNLVAALTDDTMRGRIITAKGDKLRQNIKIIDGTLKVLSPKLQRRLNEVVKHPIPIVENILNSLFIIKNSGMILDDDFLSLRVLPDIFRRIK